MRGSAPSDLGGVRAPRAFSLVEMGWNRAQFSCSQVLCDEPFGEFVRSTCNGHGTNCLGAPKRIGIYFCPQSPESRSGTAYPQCQDLANSAPVYDANPLS